MAEEQQQPVVYHGRRNLLILGAGAILFAVCTTSIGLWLYKVSGDIYLDRSRPGYLPDVEEASTDKADTSSNFVFGDMGPIEEKELDAYLTELKSVEKKIDKLVDPYSDSPLSDDSLGIVY